MFRTLSQRSKSAKALQWLAVVICAIAIYQIEWRFGGWLFEDQLGIPTWLGVPVSYMIAGFAIEMIDWDWVADRFRQKKLHDS